MQAAWTDFFFSLSLFQAESHDGVVYGVCFVDTSIGTFHVSCSMFYTLFFAFKLTTSVTNFTSPSLHIVWGQI